MTLLNICGSSPPLLAELPLVITEDAPPAPDEGRAMPEPEDFLLLAGGWSDNCCLRLLAAAVVLALMMLSGVTAKGLALATRWAMVSLMDIEDVPMFPPPAPSLLMLGLTGPAMPPLLATAEESSLEQSSGLKIWLRILLSFSSASCLLRWSLSLSPLENSLLHMLHWKGFSPVCIRRCLLRWDARAKFMWQYSQINGRSPVWRRMWSRKPD